MMIRQLPQKLFAKWEDDGEYLVAAEDCTELAGNVGNTEVVGIYELATTGKLATKAEFENDKKKRR